MTRSRRIRDRVGDAVIDVVTDIDALAPLAVADGRPTDAGQGVRSPLCSASG